MTPYADITLTQLINGRSRAVVNRLTLKSYENLTTSDEYDGSLESFILSNVLLTTEEGPLAVGETPLADIRLTKEDINKLSQADTSTFMQVLTEMLSPEAADIVKLCSDIEGDGISRPIYVPLHFPLKFGGETVTGLELTAKTFGEIRDLFRGSGVSSLSRDFLRKLAQPVGAKIALSDALLDNLDYIDFIRLRDGALGKLQGAGQKRWSKR